MNRSIRSGLAGLALMAAIPDARAATLAGVTLPDTMQVDGTTLLLNGIGVRSYTIFNIRGYVGGLYLARKAGDLASVLAVPGPKVLVIHYVHGGTPSQLREAYMDSSRLWCAHHACGPEEKAAFEALLATIHPVRPGDVATFVIDGTGVRVFLNGGQVGWVRDPRFGQIILESDLGPTAPSAELRAGLLGHPEG